MCSNIILVVRMVLRTIGSEIVERIIHIDRNNKYCWLINVDVDDHSWPRPILISDLKQQLINTDMVVELNDIWLPKNRKYEEETKAGERHSDRYNIIEPLVTGKNEVEIIYPKERKRLIAERLNSVKTTRQTISNLLQLFWKQGMTYEAVQTSYKNCGKASDDGKRNPENGKIGRPRTITLGVGINVTANIRKMFDAGVSYYNVNRKASIKDAWDKVTELYFSDRVIDEKGRIRVKTFSIDQRPTYRQFQYYESTTNDKKTRYIKREGQKKWDLECRACLGSSTDEVQGPGDKFQVDATIADTYLVSQFDRRRIVGRPVIYFIVDVFSHMITGLYVGFEGPSWIGAMMALVNMVRNKVEFCAEYDIDIEEEDWPSRHACKILLADRGELMSTRLGGNITKNLKIDIENTTPGRGDLKALVERKFGTVPSVFKKFVPGYVEPDFLKRGAPDYRLEASLDLREFTQMVICAVVDHNKTPIRGVTPPAQMITEGLQPSPVNLWKWGVANRSGSLHELTEEETKLNVMPPGTATVTKSGLHCNKAYYYSETSMKEDWFSEKSPMHGKKLDISYDPRFMDQIYLRESKDLRLENTYEVCKLFSRSAEYAGKSLYEVEENDLLNKKNIAAEADVTQSKHIEKNIEMEGIASKSKADKKKLGKDTRSKKERTDGIRDNHAEEKEKQRSIEAFEVVGNTQIDTQQINQQELDSNHDDVPFNPLDILEEIILDRVGGEHE